VSDQLSVRTYEAELQQHPLAVQVPARVQFLNGTGGIEADTDAREHTLQAQLEDILGGRRVPASLCEVGPPHHAPARLDGDLQLACLVRLLLDQARAAELVDAPLQRRSAVVAAVDGAGQLDEARAEARAITVCC
jgi:hypothetical protein